MESTKSIYTELAGLIHEYDPNLIILAGQREGEDDPDVDSSVDTYCIVRERRSRNLHITQGPVSYGTVTEGHGIRTYQNRRVVIQFDIYGKDEYVAQDKANAINAFICERLVASPDNYSFSLFGDVGNVVNNSELAYAKRYKHRYSFKLEFFYVYKLDMACHCEKMPEKLIITGEHIAK